MGLYTSFGSAGVMVFPFSRRKWMSISRHCLFACYFSCFSPLLLREFWFLPNNTTGGGGGGGKKTLVKCADFLPLQKFLGSPRVAWSGCMCALPSDYSTTGTERKKGHK